MSNSNSDSSDEEYLPENDKQNENDEDESLTESESESLEEKSVEAATSSHVTIDFKRRDELWNEFLCDTTPSSKSNTQKEESTNFASSSSTKENSIVGDSTNQNETDTKQADLSKCKKVCTNITEVFEFAGEEIKMERQTEELPSQGTVQKTTGMKRPTTGLSCIMNELTKKRKIGTLEKSKLDWDTFKKDKKIDEELQQHNRGKGGYLDKQDFLQRVDQSQFEKEKELRISGSNKQ